MRWSITLGRVAGTEVKIHITFLLFLVWIAFSAWSRGGAAAAIDSTLFIVLLFACVVLHEFGHIAAARRYGIATPEVTLLPIGGVASMQRLPSDPGQELVVALAGPAVNLVIGLVLIAALGPVHPDDLDADRQSRPFAARRASRSPTSFFVVFNLIPAFPMDGGRVLHALLAMRIGGPRGRPKSPPRIGQALRLRPRVPRPVRQSAAPVHRDLRLYRGGRRSADERRADRRSRE